jgi:hypothetical protein
MLTKTCCRCKLEKNLSEFGNLKSSKDGLMYNCRKCQTLKQKEYREKHNDTYKKSLEKNKVKISLYQKRYNQLNQKNIKDKRKIYYQNNKNKILSNNKDYHQINKEEIRKRKKEYTKEKRKTDILFNLKCNLRTRLGNFLKSKNIKKDNTTLNIVGCTPQFLKNYLESLFKDGMTWENKHLWHIDHIIPLSSVETKEELYKLCHYTNLQPLWSKENIKKGKKIL